MLEISGQRKNKAFFVATGYIVAFLGQTACHLTSYFIYFLGRIMRDYTTQKMSFFTRQSNPQHALQVVRFPLPIKHKAF
jgi:hypothetical protein